MRVFRSRHLDGFSEKVTLSRRERQVLRLVTLGRTNKQIAFDLSISVSTVKTYLTAFYRNCEPRNRVELSLWGLGHPDAFLGLAVDVTFSHPNLACIDDVCAVIDIEKSA